MYRGMDWRVEEIRVDLPAWESNLAFQPWSFEFNFSTRNWKSFTLLPLKATASVDAKSCKIEKVAHFTHFEQKNTHISGYKTVHIIILYFFLSPLFFLHLTSLSPSPSPSPSSSEPQQHHPPPDKTWGLVFFSFNSIPQFPNQNPYNINNHRPCFIEAGHELSDDMTTNNKARETIWVSTGTLYTLPNQKNTIAYLTTLEGSRGKRLKSHARLLISIRETLKIQVLDFFFFFGITIMSIIKRSLGSFFFFFN